MVEFYLLTFPRFPLRKKEHKSYFGKNRTHDFRTSRCAAYLLDHSGDERLLLLCDCDPIAEVNTKIQEAEDTYISQATFLMKELMEIMTSECLQIRVPDKPGMGPVQYK